jgi:DNA repair exonuclease SbcCD nuclease subunit
MRVLHELEKRADPEDQLLTHIGVRGSTLNTCFLLKDWSYVTFEDTKFRRIWTGHFHNHQCVHDKVWYPGSPIAFKFDEGGVPHGFMIYDTETDEQEFVDISMIGRTQAMRGEIAHEVLPPEFITVLDEQLEGLDREDLRGNMVRVVLARDYSQDEKTQIKERLKDLGAKSVRWLQPAEPSTAVSVAVVDDGLVGNQAELFAHWLEQDSPDPAKINRSLASKLAAECRHEGDERYSYEEPDE